MRLLPKTFHISHLLFFLFTLTLLQSPLGAQTAPQNPLNPVKTDHPRDTMSTFLEAMNRYREGVQTGDNEKQKEIDRAVRCLNLERIPYLVREEQGREVAIFLKEVIDRVMVIDFSKIPDNTGTPEAPLLRWRLKHTEIIIAKVDSGERAGEYLFSPDTVHRARSFYEKVKELPYLKGSGMGAGYQESWLEESLPDWTREKFFVLRWWQWIGILTAILLGLIARTVSRYTLLLLFKLTGRSRLASLQDLVMVFVGPTGLLLATFLWYLSLNLLQIEGQILIIFHFVLKVILSLSLIWFGYRFSSLLTQYLTKLAAKTESTLDDQMVPMLNRALKIFTIIFGILATIQNLGINVLSLLAGLGIGGIAIALAARDTVANFFGSLMILFDSPFQVGDWIVVGTTEGTVETIGFRSTRVRTFYNSMVTIPNSDLMNARIDNMGRREFRRIRTILGITYDTSPERLEAFLEGIKNVIKANPHTRKDYFHVVFHDYGPHSLQIMLYFFLKVPDWSRELMERQHIFLEILRLAEELGVEFAFPTTTLHVESFPEKKPTRDYEKGNPEEMGRVADSFGPGKGRSRPGGLGLFTPPFEESNSQPPPGGPGM